MHLILPEQEHKDVFHEVEFVQKLSMETENLRLDTSIPIIDTRVSGLLLLCNAQGTPPAAFFLGPNKCRNRYYIIRGTALVEAFKVYL